MNEGIEKSLEKFKSILNEEFEISYQKKKYLAKLNEVKKIERGETITEDIKIDKNYLDKQNCALIDLVLLIFNLNPRIYNPFYFGGVFKVAIKEGEELEKIGIILKRD